jgi:hypothetical protein
MTEPTGTTELSGMIVPSGTTGSTDATGATAQSGIRASHRSTRWKAGERATHPGAAGTMLRLAQCCASRRLTRWTAGATETHLGAGGTMSDPAHCES